MEKKCPACGGKMVKTASGAEIPDIPFIKIPAWVKEADAYECQECGYIGLWREKK
ncbi:MAG: hypothetical protein J7L31_04595 [Thermoplasmata archaeon]|nr:hypothetical protein [Thermoplasmata archaeon]